MASLVLGLPTGLLSALVVTTFAVVLHTLRQTQRLLSRSYLVGSIFGLFSGLIAFWVAYSSYQCPFDMNAFGQNELVLLVFSGAIAIGVGVVASWTLAQYNQVYDR